MRGNFDHSVDLIRFVLRRERVISALWIVLLAVFAVSLAPGMGDMFDMEAREALVQTLENPAMISMMGPVFGADNFDTAAMYWVTMPLWIIIAVAVMNIFLVVRHTRADEEKGRSEVVRSLPVGRLANLHAAMITAVIVNALLGAMTGAGIVAAGVEGMGFAGSALYAAVIFASGMFFAAAAALFCQLSHSPRGAAGYSFAVLGVLYMIRAVGDVGNETISYFSVLGLAQRTQAYIENHWWPVWLILLQAAAIAAVAYKLNAVRDMGQGFIPARPGRKDAPKSLGTAFGLSWRLLRTPMIVWLGVMFILGASYGSILGDIEVFINDSPFYQTIVQVSPDFPVTEMFASMVNSMMAFFCLIPLLIFALKPRSEESDGRAEGVLSRSVSRVKYLTGYAVWAFGASVLFQVATAVGLYISAAAVMEEPIPLGVLLRANLVYLPALWVMIGFAILLIGWLPKAAAVIWGYYALGFFTSFIGRVLDLPEWLNAATPFDYIPQLPVDDVSILPLAVLTAIAAALTAAGFVFYRRRDMLTV
ncbi:MAG: ABC transporter permease [Oscillospiraceae bacterium]|nr:ABC transporter permease [Oscillospiraceae bacterium]